MILLVDHVCTWAAAKFSASSFLLVAGKNTMLSMVWISSSWTTHFISNAENKRCSRTSVEHTGKPPSEHCHTQTNNGSHVWVKPQGLLVGVLLLEPSSHMPEAELYWLCRRFSMATLSALLMECWSSERDWISTDFWEMESWEQRRLRVTASLCMYTHIFKSLVDVQKLMYKTNVLFPSCKK